MKKLSLYVFLLLMFCNVGFAECIKGDCINGYGTYAWGEGTKYVGEFKNGKRHGQGTITHASGNKYVGGWKEGKSHGQGTYTYTNGGKFVGEFKNGKFHGQGTSTYTDGGKFVGEFKNGKRHGQGTLTVADGRVVKGIWKDGKLAEKAKKKKTSSPSSKEAKLIKQMAEDDENLTKKQAKCLIKKTKPLIKKEYWNKWIEVMLTEDKSKISKEEMEILFDVGFKMMAHSSECGVPIG